MSLQQQIQREIDENAKIDKAIEKKFKRLIKKSYNNYYKVDKRENSHAILVFFRKDLSIHHFCLNERNENLDIAISDTSITTFFLRCKNPRDGKRVAFGDIKNSNPK